MADKKLLDQYQAASTIGMSPKLLNWLTKHPPKQDDDRILPVAKVDNEQTYYFEEDLLGFDYWLRQAWPHAVGQRPHLPAGIKREIKEEANGECAICLKNGETCEAAHIEPVSQSKNNHPHNLIWLCANHHTKFDNGSFGPTGPDRQFVVSFKKTLHYFRKFLWNGQAQISAKVGAIVEVCSKLSVETAKSLTDEQKNAVSKMGEDVLSKLPKLDTVSRDDKIFEELKAIESALKEAASLKGASSLSSIRKIKAVSNSRVAVHKALGLVECPLCEGSGQHHGYDCPVCSAAGTVEKDRDVDLSPYQLLRCPLCTGSGKFEGYDCPVCDGDKRVESRYADSVDLSQYEYVDCPLCKGKGGFCGNDCPVCKGDKLLLRRFAETVDTSDFEKVACPLCEGRGKRNGQDCPACDGEGQVDQRNLDSIDLHSYQLVKCPLCRGRGQYAGDNCPVCDGDGKIEERFLERIDLSDYEMVNCPKCRGKGTLDDYDCPFCQGNGKVQRKVANRD